MRRAVNWAICIGSGRQSAQPALERQPSLTRGSLRNIRLMGSGLANTRLTSHFYSGWVNPRGKSLVLVLRSFRTAPRELGTRRFGSPAGEPGSRATSPRGSLWEGLPRLPLWETESPEPARRGPTVRRELCPGRGILSFGISAPRPDGCWTDPREGAPTVSGPWVQCAFNLSMFSVSCNSHYDTQFAAVFIDPRAE